MKETNIIIDFKNPAGLYVNGLTTPLIKASDWRAQEDGRDIKNAEDIGYGDLIYLWLDTEGLNGDKITIEIYNDTLGEDNYIHSEPNVEMNSGEVKYKIGNTYLWRSKISYWVSDTEQFYIKAKDKSGKYIKDHLGDDKHAIYLKINDKTVKTGVEQSENLTPTKVFEPATNFTKDEPCKFESISIDKIPVFKEGDVLKEVAAKRNNIDRTVYFDFDKSHINAETAGKLDNILAFLLRYPGTKITLSGYACVIGKEQYNKELSQKRSDAIRDFFAKGKLEAGRITSVGYGEKNITDDDSIKHINEKNYIEARRVDIIFNTKVHSAIIYETIAPSEPKDVIIDVTGYDTKDCFRETNKHKVQISSVSPDGKEKEGSTSLALPIQSTLSKANPAPLQYIWPRYNLTKKGGSKDAAAIYHVDIHSCRYFFNAYSPTVIIKAYPDIKWTLEFFLNLTNDLSVKWQNQPASKHKELQSKAGKIGAEKRWEQKDASFGFSLKAEWDKTSSGKFSREKELKQEYETKFKKLYSMFSSIGNMSKGITSKTKGQVRNIGFKEIPMIFAIKPPNLSIKGIWYLEKIDDKFGTKVDISFNAQPLIGLEMTIDLLCLAVGAVAGAFTGGTASGPAMNLYKLIKGKINDGLETGNENLGVSVKADIFIDLVISSTIKTSIGFNFNTAVKKPDVKIEATNTLKIELKAGLWVKAEFALVIVKLEGYFEMSASGSAAVTFGHEVNYDDKGLYYRPQLGFDGMKAEYVIKGKVGLSSTKKVVGGTPTNNDMVVIDSGEEQLVEPFDVIKSLEELFDFNANIPLIKN